MRETRGAGLGHIDAHHLDGPLLLGFGEPSDEPDVGIGADAAHAKLGITPVKKRRQGIEEHDALPEISAILGSLDGLLS